MSVIRRIQRLYRPVTDPMYTRNDIEVDSRTLLDPNVPKDELPGGEPENITDVPVLDQTPLESIMESHNKYNKPDFHVHVNEIKHPEKDKVPEDRPESLLKTQDSGSEIDDTLETDDNYRPQYVPSAVVSYYNESANGGKLIERRKGPGGNYIWVDRSVTSTKSDTGIMADDIVDNYRIVDPTSVDISRFSGVKTAEDVVRQFNDMLHQIIRSGRRIGQRTDGMTAGLYIMARVFAMKSDVDADTLNGLIPFDLSPNDFKEWRDSCVEGLIKASNAYRAIANAQGILIGESIASARLKDDPKVRYDSLISTDLVDVFEAPATRIYDFSKVGRGIAYVNATSGIVDIARIKSLLNMCREFDCVVMSHGGDVNGAWTIDPIYINGHMCRDANSAIKAIHEMNPDASIGMYCCNPGAHRPKDEKNVRYLPVNVMFESALPKTNDSVGMVEEFSHVLKRLTRAYNSIRRVINHLNDVHPVRYSMITVGDDGFEVSTNIVKNSKKWKKAMDRSLTDVYNVYSRFLLTAISLTRTMYRGHVDETGYRWYHSVNDTEDLVNLHEDVFADLDECILDAANYAQCRMHRYTDDRIVIRHESVNGQVSLDYGEIMDEAVRIIGERIINDPIRMVETLYESTDRQSSYRYPSQVSEYYNSAINESAMKAKQRNALDDSEFGLPRLRAYPLNDAKHVKAAIRMFNHCKDPEDQKTLANNIFKAMRKHGVDMKIGEGNNLYKYAPQELREDAWPKMLVQAVGKPMSKRTKDEIVKEHLRVNSDFYNNVFYGVEYANAIRDLDNMDFLEVFYPNVRSMAFGNRIFTCIGGYHRLNTTAGKYDANRNWFKVDLSKDTDHRDYCVRLYDVMEKMLLDEYFDPRTLGPDEMGTILDWQQHVSYHYGCLMDADNEATRRRETQYLWDLFWNYNENPDDPEIKSMNIIAFVSQMRSVIIKGKLAAVNEDQIVGRQELRSYLEKELGQGDDIYLLPKTKEFPIIDQLSVHLAMDKVGAVPEDQRRTFSDNLNRRYRELGCTFSITPDHPYARYASKDVVRNMAHVLMEDSSLPIDDQSHADEDRINRAAQTYVKRSDYVPGSNWHNILDNREMGPNNLKQQRPDYTAGEALL